MQRKGEQLRKNMATKEREQEAAFPPSKKPKTEAAAAADWWEAGQTEAFAAEVEAEAAAWRRWCG